MNAAELELRMKGLDFWKMLAKLKKKKRILDKGI
jgi:hypothetical protein